MADRVEELEDELMVLKNEIKETLTDIREHLLTYIENPFAAVRQTPEIEVVAMHHKIMVQEAPGASEQVLVRPEPEPARPAPPPRPETVRPASPPRPETVPAPEALPLSSEPPAPPLPEVPPGAEPQQPWDVSPALESQEALLRSMVAGGPNQLGQGPPPGGEPEPAALPGQGPAGTTADEMEAPETNLNGKGRVVNAGATPPEAEVEENLAVTSHGPDRVAPAPRDDGAPGELLTMFTLAPWLDEGISRIGRKRLKAIVEVYATTGGVSQQLKEGLLQMISLDNSVDGGRGKVSIRECLRQLGELDNLLWRHRVDPQGAALLALVRSDTSPLEQRNS